MFSMDREIAIKWIDRLESLPPESQGSGALNKNGKMCCLGVLSEIALENGIVDSRIDAYTGKTVYGETENEVGDDVYLTSAVIDWAKIDTLRNKWNPSIDGVHLATMNDDMNMSFQEIAGELRKHFGLLKE
jgi:hypothetical protein